MHYIRLGLGTTGSASNSRLCLRHLSTGCYTEDGWRTTPRFYGSGETFVFQLEPHRVM